jgi:serine/threonine protein kinase
MNPISSHDDQSSAPSLPLDQVREIDRICDAFNEALKAGHGPRIEDHLGRIAAAGRSVLLRELIITELEFQFACGMRPDWDAYVSRFPDDRRIVDAALARLKAISAASGACQEPQPRGNHEGMDSAASGTIPPAPDGYRIVRFLGKGTFGEAWLAADDRLKREVVFKTIRSRVDEERRKRALSALKHEAQVLAGLRHPNLVGVHAWLHYDDTEFLLMQYVRGGSLARRIKELGKPLAWRTAARYVADVGEGLTLAHERGIIHRDIKPANILWDPDRDEALLCDFGISAQLADDPTVAGSPGFMAPEVFEGIVSPVQDVYSLAATLFCLVTGDLPFPTRDVGLLRDAQLLGLPEPDARCKGIPEPLERLIRAGLAAAPERRPCLNEFVSTLRRLLNQLLTDSLIQARAAGTVDLRIMLSRQAESGVFLPLGATYIAPSLEVRDMKAIPPPPEVVTVRSGDRVRIEVAADRPGYVTVYNVGPTGNLNLLFPGKLAGDPARSRIQAGRPLQVMNVEVTPPAGSERLFAVWTRELLPLRLDEVHDLVESGSTPASAAYRATRDMVRIEEAVQQLRPHDWCAAVLKIEHVDN